MTKLINQFILTFGMFVSINWFYRHYRCRSVISILVVLNIVNTRQVISSRGPLVSLGPPKRSAKQVLGSWGERSVRSTASGPMGSVR